MVTYVLVHGPWHGSWCWKRICQALFTAGHDVFTPTLTQETRNPLPAGLQGKPQRVPLTDSFGASRDPGGASTTLTRIPKPSISSTTSTVQSAPCKRTLLRPARHCPAFGYCAARGTSTLLNNALLSPPYGPLSLTKSSLFWPSPQLLLKTKHFSLSI